MNIIRIFKIIKMLKKGLQVKTIKEVEYQVRDFYTRYGVIENKHRKCETFYESKGE